MAEPLVTISLSDYNNLLAKKSIFEFLSETTMSCKTWDEIKEKIEKPSYGLEIAGTEITVKFLVYINKK